MSHDAAYHDGYMKALQDLDRILETITIDTERIAELRREIGERIEKARCLSRSSLAAGASGKAGY
ncbi:MAG: hypothetical protein ACYTGZ_10945 [Planctomycetota bacterium]|jgi:hypothetical protein